MLCLIMLISIGTPIDKAMIYFYVITAIYSFLTIASIVGIAAFLIGTGFYPTPKVYMVEKDKWVDLPSDEYPP